MLQSLPGITSKLPKKSYLFKPLYIGDEYGSSPNGDLNGEARIAARVIGGGGDVLSSFMAVLTDNADYLLHLFIFGADEEGSVPRHKKTAC